MDKLEMLEKLYADVAFFCERAILNPSEQKAYQYKMVGVVHAMETIGVINSAEFCYLMHQIWNSENLKSLFIYVNSKGGYLYEI